MSIIKRRFKLYNNRPSQCINEMSVNDLQLLKTKASSMAKACDKYAFALELQGQGRSTELLKRHNRAIERKYKWLLTWSEVESKCRAKAEEYR